MKGLELACLNEDLKYYNKGHPLWFHERTAHFRMNLMLMESIKLTCTEMKFLFIVTDYVQKGRGRIGVPPEATVCLMCDMEKDFQTFYLYFSAKAANEAVACADR